MLSKRKKKLVTETPKEKPEGLLIIIMNGANESFLIV